MLLLKCGKSNTGRRHCYYFRVAVSCQSPRSTTALQANIDLCDTIYSNPDQPINRTCGFQAPDHAPCTRPRAAQAKKGAVRPLKPPPAVPANVLGGAKRNATGALARYLRGLRGRAFTEKKALLLALNTLYMSHYEKARYYPLRGQGGWYFAHDAAAVDCQRRYTGSEAANCERAGNEDLGSGRFGAFTSVEGKNLLPRSRPEERIPL